MRNGVDETGHGMLYWLLHPSVRRKKIGFVAIVVLYGAGLVALVSDGRLELVAAFLLCALTAAVATRAGGAWRKKRNTHGTDSSEE